MSFLWLQMVTVISTFAGCGGSSLGYQMAGFKELLAIEWEDNAVQTFRLNFPDVPVWQRDIKSVTVEEILNFTGLKKGELTVFDGSPPCQGFSTAGKRQLKDERNDLFKEYCRLLTGLQPKVFVMENVSGMIKGKMKGKFLEILQTLKDCGYNVKCKLMNAMWYDVPQSRERVIFIGIRNDLGLEPSYPDPNSYFIPCKDICDNESGEDISKYAIYAELLRLKEGQKSDKYLNLIKADRNKPLNAITKTAGICGAASVAKWNNKKFTVNELQLCQSFPLTFRFIGNYTNAVERIGNSVPPNLMKAIALHILTIFKNVSRETSVLNTNQ